MTVTIIPKITIYNPSCPELLKLFDYRGERPHERVEVTGTDAQGREYSVRGRITCADITYETDAEDGLLAGEDYVAFEKRLQSINKSKRASLPMSSRAYIEVQPEGSVDTRVHIACQDRVIVINTPSVKSVLLDQDRISRICVFEDPSSFAQVYANERHEEIIQYTTIDDQGNFTENMRALQDKLVSTVQKPATKVFVTKTGDSKKRIGEIEYLSFLRDYPCTYGGYLPPQRIDPARPGVFILKNKDEEVCIKYIRELRIETEPLMSLVNTTPQKDVYLVAGRLGLPEQNEAGDLVPKFIICDVTSPLTEGGTPSMETLMQWKANNTEATFILQDLSEQGWRLHRAKIFKIYPAEPGYEDVVKFNTTDDKAHKHKSKVKHILGVFGIETPATVQLALPETPSAADTQSPKLDDDEPFFDPSLFL